MGRAPSAHVRRARHLIAVDTNVLVAAHRADAPAHAQAAASVRDLAEGSAPWAIPWPCVHEFIAITTHLRIFNPPSKVRQAIDQVDAWMESPTLQLLSESNGYWDILDGLLSNGKITGPRAHDARVAALCRHHGVSELWTADRDFSRFPGLKTRNPLIG